MTKNVGAADRVVRIVVALGLGLLIYMKTLEGTAGDRRRRSRRLSADHRAAGDAASSTMIGVDTSVQEQPYSSTDDRAGSDQAAGG